jgi:hypothetical protein
MNGDITAGGALLSALALDTAALPAAVLAGYGGADA